MASMGEVAQIAGENARQLFAESRKTIAKPRECVDYLKQIFLGRDYESFVVVFLGSRNQVISCVEMFRGTIDGSAVYPREVVKECLWRGAAAVILAHNHPSGVSEPSQPDQIITKRLQQALALIEVRVLDHLVIGGNGQWSSMAESGLM